MDTTTKHELWVAVEAFDAEAAELAISKLLWDIPLSGAVAGVVLPFLREVGERWEAGTLSVAHEHFVTEMLRDKLSALSSMPHQRPLGDAGARSPVVFLACPAGERHDLVLLCVALMLRERGVRARFLGADTPMPALLSAVQAAGADAVVLAAMEPTAFTAHTTALQRLAQDHALYVAGRGADEQTAAEIGATALPADPVRAVVFLVGELSGRLGGW